jgi:hypothetical protein
MSDFEFDADVVATLPGGLTPSAAGLHRATTVTAPDTGATTAETFDGLQTLTTLATALGVAVEDLAADLYRCVEIFRDTDWAVMRGFLMKAAIS